METHYDEIDGDLLILAADGGLNKQTAEELIESIGALVDAGLTKVIVDCSKVDVISSFGLGVLLRLHKRMERKGGDVKLCGLTGIVPEVLRATKLDRLFDVYDDVNRARLAFRKPGEAPHAPGPGHRVDE